MSQEQSFWEQRWKEAQTGWDLGAASPALMSYAQSRSERAAKILIPGCGSAWEAAALIDLGYTILLCSIYLPQPAASFVHVWAIGLSCKCCAVTSLHMKGYMI